MIASPILGDLLPLVFNFDDDFFTSKNFVPSFPNFLDELKLFSNDNLSKLKVLHLNVNSLFLKKAEVLEIVSLKIFDIISLNETKLDDSIPESFFF